MCCGISKIASSVPLGFAFSVDEEQVVRSFLKEFRLIEVISPVMELTVETRRKKKMKLPDAIIAASAIHNDLILVTRNIKDFKGIEVKILDPFSI